MGISDMLRSFLCSIKISGGNGYNVPHIRKGMLEGQGLLPMQLSCEATLVEEANAKLNE